MPKNSFNQKGVIPLVVIFIVLVVIGGGVIGVKSGLLKLTAAPSNPGSSVSPYDRVPAKNTPSPASSGLSQNNLSNNTNSPSSASAASTKIDSTWQTYTSKNGYSIKYPKGWTVETLSSDTKDELIRVKDSNKSAFVLIETIIGPSLQATGELEKVTKYMADKFKNNSHIKISTFNDYAQNGIGGYTASGELTYEDKTVIFEERFRVGKNGRGIRTEGAYTPDSKEINQPITSAIVGSFKATN